MEDSDPLPREMREGVHPVLLAAQVVVCLAVLPLVGLAIYTAGFDGYKVCSYDGAVIRYQEGHRGQYGGCAFEGAESIIDWAGRILGAALALASVLWLDGGGPGHRHSRWSGRGFAMRATLAGCTFVVALAAPFWGWPPWAGRLVLGLPLLLLAALVLYAVVGRSRAPQWTPA